jgi:uncharacterized membrane protein YagU involved in acid resistance
MKLNKNSISAKLFRWFYRTSELPTNLCPYFWKLVMAYVFVIPLFIISLPYVIIEKYSSSESLGNRIGLGLVGWFVLFLLIVVLIAALSPIMLFWYTPIEDSSLEILIICGLLTWVLGLTIGVMWFIHHLGEKIKERRNLPKKEKRSNIIVEMVKATYYKYCPKIDWN